MLLVQTLRPVAAAVFTNLAMGLLYCWPLFAEAVRARLDASQAVISGVPALSLLAFTLGANLYPSLSSRFPLRRTTTAAFLASMTGIGVFAVFPSVATIYIGYGLLFGVASGVGYMLALAFVREVPPPFDKLSLGICMTSFALTAILFTVPVQLSLDAVGLQVTLYLIIGGLLACGVLVVCIIGRSASISPARHQGDRVRPRHPFAPTMAFFTFCFVGLAVMANSRVVLSLLEIDATTAQASAATFNLAYIGGALSGGLVVGLIGGNKAILSFLTLLTASLCYALATGSAASAWAMISVAACCLGATASTFPAYIAQYFGQEHVTPIFARLLIFYGFAGSISPWLLVATLQFPGGIRIFLAASLVLCATSIAAVALTKQGSRQGS